MKLKEELGDSALLVNKKRRLRKGTGVNVMSKLYFRYGAMNSGKTAALLQVAHNYEEKGMNVVVIKSAIDTKGDNKVISRLGIERQVDVMLAPNEGIMEHMIPKRPDAIIVDEAQFLTPDQVDELYAITKMYGVPVLAYGLRCDFQMKGFPGASRLLELADDIEELKTICCCGKKATQNIRLIDGEPTFEGSQVAIDGTANITYDSVCGECYLKLRRRHG